MSITKFCLILMGIIGLVVSVYRIWEGGDTTATSYTSRQDQLVDNKMAPSVTASPPFGHITKQPSELFSSENQGEISTISSIETYIEFISALFIGREDESQPQDINRERRFNLELKEDKDRRVSTSNVSTTEGERRGGKERGKLSGGVEQDGGITVRDVTGKQTNDNATVSFNDVIINATNDTATVFVNEWVIKLKEGLVALNEMNRNEFIGQCESMVLLLVSIALQFGCYNTRSSRLLVGINLILLYVMYIFMYDNQVKIARATFYMLEDSMGPSPFTPEEGL